MFHKSNLGGYGDSLPSDQKGYVAELGDGPWDFVLDHGERTHSAEGELTEYGVWWEEEGFPEWRDQAVERTRAAVRAVDEWRRR